MAHNHGQQLFDEPYFVTGTVTKVYQVPNPTGPLTVDVLPLNSNWLAKQIPWFCPAGLTRNARLGMQVGILCIHGSPKFATAMSHIFNTDDPEQHPLYADPLPAAMEMPDDLVLHHDETLAYLRFRNYGSTPQQAGPDGGSPVIFDLAFNSGALLELTEYPPPGYPDPGTNPPEGYVPPPPTRAKLSLQMPSGTNLIIDEPEDQVSNLTLTMSSGAQLALDEPEAGQATLSLTMPSGAEVTIDANGVVTVTAPETLNLVAPTVNVGDDTGTAPLAFKSDVQAVVTAFNAHQHNGVQTGGGVSGTTTRPATPPVGTVNTQAL